LASAVASVVGLALVSTFVVNDVGASDQSTAFSTAANSPALVARASEPDSFGIGAAATLSPTQASAPPSRERRLPIADKAIKQSAAEQRSLTKKRSPAVRHFAWSPVAKVVGYEVELFLGTQRVFQRTTTQPSLDIPATWTYHGHKRRLTPGSYRWYVWPVLQAGRSGVAIVRAKLRVT
jgi:hypothetical protein